MIDIQLLRDQPEMIKQKSLEKKMQVDVDRILSVDASYRESLIDVEQLRQKKNELSSQMKNGKPDQALIETGKQIKTELQNFVKQMI